MKKSFLLGLFTLSLLCSFPFSSAQAASESKADFEKRFKAERIELKAEIASLEKKAKKLDKKTRVATHKKIKAIEAGIKDLDKKSDAFESESKEDWESLKVGLDKAADDLKKGCKDIAASFK